MQKEELNNSKNWQNDADLKQAIENLKKGVEITENENKNEGENKVEGEENNQENNNQR